MPRTIDNQIWIYEKYKNNVIPSLPLIIYSYLLNHMDELGLFLYSKMDINDLLNYISNNTNINEKPILINLVKEYIKNHVWLFKRIKWKSAKSCNLN